MINEVPKLEDDYYFWQKRLGDIHINKPGSGKTLCNIPCPGNNWYNKKEPTSICPECLKRYHTLITKKKILA